MDGKPYSTLFFESFKEPSQFIYSGFDCGFRGVRVLDLNSNNLTSSLEHVFKIGTSFPGGSLTYIDLSDNNFTSGTLERLERGSIVDLGCEIEGIEMIGFRLQQVGFRFDRGLSKSKTFGDVEATEKPF
ncbi:hypothetical protein V6N13_106123 [Hibiscus sabdariffa]